MESFFTLAELQNALQVDGWGPTHPSSLFERTPTLDGRLLYLRGELPLQEPDASDLEEVTARLYAELFLELRGKGLSLARIWNWVPDINRHASPDGFGAAEHYKRFNAGRRRSWLAEDESLGSVCAATAVGRQDGVAAIELHALAVRGPVEHFENPRQTPFLDYSQRYGPPPCSRRATRAGPWLFVAGTSSIVGEDTRHGQASGERVVEQTHETLKNLRILVPPEGGEAFRGVRVYLRDVTQASRVSAQIAAELGIAVEDVRFAGADICRLPLDVEIECVVTRAT